MSVGKAAGKTQEKRYRQAIGIRIDMCKNCSSSQTGSNEVRTAGRRRRRRRRRRPILLLLLVRLLSQVQAVNIAHTSVSLGMHRSARPSGTKRREKNKKQHFALTILSIAVAAND